MQGEDNEEYNKDIIQPNTTDQIQLVSMQGKDNANIPRMQTYQATKCNWPDCWKDENNEQYKHAKQNH